MARALIAWLIASLVGFAVPVRADEPVRRDIRLYGADLIDEMVYDWLKSPPFGQPVSLIVAEVDGPVGVGTRFAEDVENHLFEVLRANPKLSLQLVHCSLCRNKIAVSNPKRTIIADALSTLEGAEQLRRYPHQYALSLHFDLAGGDLALWAEIYETAPPQRIAWARRFSVETSSRAVLQEPTRLVGIPEARAEQRRLIEGRDTLQLVTRFPIRNFAPKEGATGSATSITPLIFVEQSVEATLSPRRAQRAGLSVGVTSIKDSLQGWTVGAHFQQLLGRAEPSLTQPDVYLRAGVTFLRLEGPGAAPFANSQLDVAKLANDKDEPRASLTAFQLGIEAHVKYRFGFLAFVEYMPVLDNSLIATQRLIVPVHSVGFAGVLRW